MWQCGSFSNNLSYWAATDIFSQFPVRSGNGPSLNLFTYITYIGSFDRSIIFSSESWCFFFFDPDFPDVFFIAPCQDTSSFGPGVNFVADGDNHHDPQNQFALRVGQPRIEAANFRFWWESMGIPGEWFRCERIWALWCARKTTVDCATKVRQAIWYNSHMKWRYDVCYRLEVTPGKYHLYNSILYIYILYDSYEYHMTYDLTLMVPGTPLDMAASFKWADPQLTQLIHSIQLQVEPVQDVPGVKEIVPLDADSHLPTWKNRWCKKNGAPLWSAIACEWRVYKSNFTMVFLGDISIVHTSY